MSDQDYHDAIVEAAKECVANGAAILRASPVINRQVVMTKQQMLARIGILTDEIDANEEENRMMQEEISSLYAKIDALDL